MKRNLVISSFLTLGLIACGGEETPNDNNNKQGDTTSDVVVKSCDSGTFGPDCQPVTCVHGTANDGKDGDGKCASCNNGWSGDNCDQCAERYTGKNCDQCKDNFTGDNCDQCANGYTGANCNKITCVNGTLDSESGTCNSCEGNWYGDNCDQCKSNFTGDNCDQCAAETYGTNCTAYGSFTASDGNTYKTVVINNTTWMAENLRNSSVDHYSAKNDSKNDATYGYLYTYENAMKACPEGWNLPEMEDFLALIGATRSGELISTTAIQDTSWVSDATNSTGFSALPAGFRDTNGDFYNLGSWAYFWSSTPNGSSNAYLLWVYSTTVQVHNNSVDQAYSVRCIKDEG